MMKIRTIIIACAALVIVAVILCLALIPVPVLGGGGAQDMSARLTLETTGEPRTVDITELDTEALFEYLSACKAYRAGINTGSASGTVTFSLTLGSPGKTTLIFLGGGSNYVTFSNDRVFTYKIRDAQKFIGDVMKIADPGGEYTLRG